jgi:predicted RNase H-like HicB family nuclease
MARQQYTAEYSREDGWWIVRILEVRGVHSNGRTLEEARRRVREALSLEIGDTAFEVQFAEKIQLPLVATRELSRHRTQRRKAEAQTREAMKATRTAALALARAGLSVRDAGALLGLTGARVSQIIKEARIGALKGRIRVKGNIESTGQKWTASG